MMIKPYNLSTLAEKNWFDSFGMKIDSRMRTLITDDFFIIFFNFNFILSFLFYFYFYFYYYVYFTL